MTEKYYPEWFSDIRVDFGGLLYCAGHKEIHHHSPSLLLFLLIEMS